MRTFQHELDSTEELDYCPKCGTGEGGMPTHCPQRKLTEEEQLKVTNGQLDFRHGYWVDGVSTWNRSIEDSYKNERHYLQFVLRQVPIQLDALKYAKSRTAKLLGIIQKNMQEDGY